MKESSGTSSLSLSSALTARWDTSKIDRDDFLLQLRYANNSEYKKDKMIRKEVYVSKTVMDQLKSIVEDSQVWQS